jgi:hypothetical protein
MAEEQTGDDKFEKIDDESLTFLEQVRKGKARYFVLSMKGNKVRSLIVKKKPVKQKDRKAARGGGYQPVFGVATGMGAKITFSIARSDGFDEKIAACKTEKLKKFLAAQTGKMFAPAFELLDTPPPIPFDDEDLNDPLIARFMKLEPVINKACDLHPEQVSTIQQTVTTIRLLLQDEETRGSAGPRIDEFVLYLKELLASDTTVSSSPPTESDQSVLAGKLAALLKKLKPLLERVVAAHPNRKNELHATLAQIVGEIKGQQFDQAKENITAFATLLKSLVAQKSEASGGQSVDRSMEFAARRNALEPRLLEAQLADRERATKLGAVWDYADEQARNGDFESAFTALGRLEAAIDQIRTESTASTQTRQDSTSEEEPAPQTPEQTAPISNVALQQSLLAWDAARKAVHSDLQELEKEILELFSDDPRLGEVRTKTVKLDAVLGDYAEDLRDRLDDAYNAPEEYKPQLRAEAITVLKKYRSYLSADPFVKAVAGNLLKPIDVEGVLVKTLDDVAKKLGA